MKAFSIFIDTLKQSGRMIRVITWVWLGTMLVALPGCWSVFSGMKSALGQTAVPGEWLKRFDMVYLNDVFAQQSSLPPAFLAIGTALVLLGAVLYVVLTGGIIGSLREHSAEEPTFREFLGFGGKFFGPFLGIFVLTLAVILISFVFSMIPFAGIPLAILAAAFWIVNGDVTKIRYVQGEHSWFKLYFASIQWTVRNFHKLAILYLLNLIVLGAGFFVYRLLDGVIVPHGWFLIFIVFLVQQAFVFVRAMVKVNVLACVQHAWDAWKPVPAAIPELSQMPLEIPLSGEGTAPLANS